MSEAKNCNSFQPSLHNYHLELLPDVVLDRIFRYLDAGSLRNVLSLPNHRIHDLALHVVKCLDNLIERSRSDWYPKPPVDNNDIQLEMVLKDVFWLCQLDIEFVHAHRQFTELSQLIARPYHRDTEYQYRVVIGHLYLFLIKVCMPPEPMLQFPRRTDRPIDRLDPPPPPARYRTIEQHLDDFDLAESEKLVLDWFVDESNNNMTFCSFGRPTIPTWMLYIYTHSCILKSVLPTITRLNVRCPPNRMWDSLPHFEQLGSLRVSNMRSDDLQQAITFVAEHGQLRKLHLEGQKPIGWPIRWHDLNVPIVRAMRRLQNNGMDEGQQPLILSDIRRMPVQELVVNSCTFLSNETMQQLLSHLPELRILSLDGHTIESPVQRDANNLGYDPMRYRPPPRTRARLIRRRRRIRMILLFIVVFCTLSLLLLILSAFVCMSDKKTALGFQSDDY